MTLAVKVMTHSRQICKSNLRKFFVCVVCMKFLCKFTHVFVQENLTRKTTNTKANTPLSSTCCKICLEFERNETSPVSSIAEF